MAFFIQSRISEVFAVDIHPAVKVGRGVFIDHATGIVIGETAVIEDDVSMLQGVTLGGTGKERGDRHPKIRRGVLIGAHALVIGNIEVGEYSRVGGGSVVLEPVPSHCTVAGVPARPKGCAAPRPPPGRWSRTSSPASSAISTSESAAATPPSRSGEGTEPRSGVAEGASAPPQREAIAEHLDLNPALSRSERSYSPALIETR